jgi:hypothetical protein
MVRELLSEPAAVIAEEWSCRPLGGGPAWGTASTWPPGRRSSALPPIPGPSCARCAPADGADPGAWDYPGREGLAYGSGLLADLPGGLATPRCLAVEAQSDGKT